MNYEAMLRESIRKLPVYEPGRPIELVAREFGLDPSAVDKLASNENPLGPSPKALAAAQAALKQIWLYPENSSYFLKQKLGERTGMPSDQLLLSAGSNEIFYLLGHAFVQPGTEVVMGHSAFITYKIVTLLHGGVPVEVPLTQGLVHDLDAMLAAITPKTRLVYLPNPNNPTGTVVENEALFAFVRKLPEHVVFVYDEAYVEYCHNPPDLRPLIAEGRKVIACRTFSKIYGLAGLRVGYGMAPKELISILERIRPPFNLGSIAQAAALAALDDEEHVTRSKASNQAGLTLLAKGLKKLGIDSIPSQGNFLLFKVGPNADTIFSLLQQRGIILRPVKGYGLPEYLRVSVGTDKQNANFLTELAKITTSCKPA